MSRIRKVIRRIFLGTRIGRRLTLLAGSAAATFLVAHLGLVGFNLSILLMSAGLSVTNLVSYLLARALITGRIAGHGASIAHPGLGSANDG